MKKICFFLFISKALLAQINPTPNLPWIKSQTARIATTNPSDLDDISKGISTIQYLDGSGRGLQTVNYKASPNQKDFIQGSNTLDLIGRPDKAFLPIASSAQNAQYQGGYAAIAETFYNDTKPFSKVDIYDSSPLSTTLKTLGPGLAFQSVSTKGISQDFQTAGAGIRKYTLVDATTINASGTYQNGDLIKSVTIDEDGNEVTQYTGGKSGRLLQVHQKNRNTAELLITAYVYDFMGRLRFVIPPKIYNAFSGTFFVSGATFDGIYRFEYDSRSRLVESNKPGGGSTHSIYNELGQLVMSQNARQATTNLWEWVKYDGHGRKIMAGVIINTNSRATLQGYFDSFTQSEQYEERASTSQILGYTSRSFPSQITIAENDVKAVYYYDDYTWQTNALLNFQQYKSPRWTNARGLATGSKVRNLANNSLMASVVYYDDKNRPIQTRTINRFGVVNQTDNVLNFAGELLEERTIYRKPSQADLVVSNQYTYDHVGRKTSAIQKINGKITPIAQYRYDAIGRLLQKNLMKAGQDSIIENSAQPDGDIDIANKYVELKAGTYTATNGTYLACITPEALQNIDYSYNITGALRGINLDASGNLSLTSGDVFGLKLDYHETAQTYNGKVNKLTWAGASGSRSFTYGYDGYDRLNSATYIGQGAENYTMPAVTYDANGNITTLQRNGLLGQNVWGQTDNLAYQYSNTQIGNVLYGIRDFSSPGVDFLDNASFADYTYYNDGSQKSDANKGITLIEYTYHGLPEKIHFGSSQRIENTYDAEGLKLSQKLINGATISTTDYMGSLIYTDGSLKTILHDEGRVHFDASQEAHYQFFIADHLGNTRVIIERLNGTTALVQETHYGAWGEVLKGIGVTGDWDFLYQGKEYVDAFGYNNYDFEARQYDPYSGRFNAIDPVPNYNLSGFAGMANNPISYVDPDGRTPLLAAVAIGAVFGGFINGAKSDMAGKGFWNGAWKGALVGGIGGALGYYAPIGILPGIGYGAVSGAATGALSAGLNNQNVGRGALYGAIGGAVFGGISGGLQADKLGANIWTGYRPPHEMQAGDILTNSFAENRLDNSENQLNDFKKNNFSSVKSNYKLTTKTPGSYTSDGVYFYNSQNQKIAGVTVSRIWKGGSSGSIHFAPVSFHSPETMFLTMGHELGHSAIHIFAGSTYSEWEQHQSIYDWEFNVSRVNNWNDYARRLSTIQPFPIIWQHPSLKNLLSSFPLKIAK